MTQMKKKKVIIIQMWDEESPFAIREVPCHSPLLPAAWREKKEKKKKKAVEIPNGPVMFEVAAVLVDNRMCSWDARLWVADLEFEKILWYLKSFQG